MFEKGNTNQITLPIGVLLVNTGSETKPNTNFLFIFVEFTVNLAQKNNGRAWKLHPSDGDFGIHHSFFIQFL